MKFKYSRRNIFWGCMKQLLSRGKAIATTAIAKTKDVYGDESVAKIFQKIRPNERAGGGHANSRT